MDFSKPNPQISNQVRVRFAPSPTGYLHVGGARTVLFNWLFAKHTGGKLILRIEDTDQERSTREAERMQIEDIKWLGFDYQEGPEVGGPHAPYRQSERLEIYAKYGRELMESGKAYYCFCSEEELEKKRMAAMTEGGAPQYDGTCRKISVTDAAKRVAAGEKATVRFRATVKEYRLNDAVRGEVVFGPNMVGDFIVLRQDGMPVYNFCCVIDDYLMKITHVIRAEEHLSNTVRQMMLYEAFGWPLPVFAHCSLILGSDRSKLSKRHGATSVHQYQEEGFLPDALSNFLVLLGWSSPDQKEVLTKPEMIAGFTLDRINKSPSVFDPVKLKWMNSEYIKAAPLSQITELAIPFMKKAGLPIEGRDRSWIERAFDVARSRIQTLDEVANVMWIFFDDMLKLEPEAEPVKAEGTFSAVATALKGELAAHLGEKGEVITPEDFNAIQDKVKARSGAKGKGLFMPMRVVLTGQAHGPDLKLVVPLIGARSALSRVERFA